MPSSVERGADGQWQGDDADAGYAAAMMNAMESGQLVWTRYNEWGQHLPPSYSSSVTPDEKARREVLAKERGHWRGDV